jgi:hypothetical protein
VLVWSCIFKSSSLTYDISTVCTISAYFAVGDPSNGVVNVFVTILIIKLLFYGKHCLNPSVLTVEDGHMNETLYM